MAQLFPQWSNVVIRAVFVLLITSPVSVPAVLMVAVRTPYRTGVGIVRSEPVPFSHQHHVGEMNLDCRYCHETVEQAPFAGMPSTHVCMTCHSQLWTEAQLLAPVRQSFLADRALSWPRINDLPDYVYFDHSIHVNKGVGCESCHGRIDKMPLTYAEQPFFMHFCLECHRAPEQFLRPLSKVTAMGWSPAQGQAVLGEQLVAEFQIQKFQLTDCSICHR